MNMNSQDWPTSVPSQDPAEKFLGMESQLSRIEATETEERDPPDKKDRGEQSQKVLENKSLRFLNVT